MFKKELFQLLIQVITSWQVLAITIAIIVYLNIVFYYARSYRSPKAKKVRVKSKKPKAEETGAPDVSGESGNSNDDLGLEEA